jgi:hypothetical protein
MKVWEAFKKQLTLANQDVQVIDPTWKNLAAAAKRRRVDEDKCRSSQKLHNNLLRNQI